MAANRKRISRMFYRIYAKTVDGAIYTAVGRREDAGKALKLVNRQNGFNRRNGMHIDMDEVECILLEEVTIELPAQVFETYGTMVRRNTNLIYERKENER